MTECYSPFPAFLAPEGYGLVVIDMVNNQILSSQGYCRFGHLNMAAVLNDKGDKYNFEIEDESNYFRAKEFFQNKLATYLRIVKKKGKYTGEPTGIDFKQFLELIEDYQKNPTKKKYKLFSMSKIQINLSPFTIKYYDKCNDMLPDLEGLGFKITKKEEQLWGEWKKEMESDDDN